MTTHDKLLGAALAGAMFAGCDCDCEITIKVVDRIAHAHIAHDAWCTLMARIAEHDDPG